MSAVPCGLFWKSSSTVWGVEVKPLFVPLLILAAGLGLNGCSTVSGWFTSGSTKLKPAELVEFKATQNVKPVWSVNLGEARPYLLTPGTDGAAIYAAARGGNLARIDPGNGREVWRVDTGKTLSAGVGVGNGLVLVGTHKGELLAYRAADGQPAWRARLSGEILTPPVVGQGVVAARSNDGNLYLLDAIDGKRRWVHGRSLPALILREPGHLVLTPRALFAGHPGGKLSAHALGNGAALWEVNVTLPRGTNELERIADVSGPLGLAQNLVCAAAYQGRVACFDPRNGNAIWARDFSGLSGVELAGRWLYAVDDAGAVQAFDAARGGSVWKQDKLRDRRPSTPLTLGNLIATGDFQGYIHLLDAETGAFVARVATDGSPIIGQMLALDRGFVAQTAKGGVFAFKID